MSVLNTCTAAAMLPISSRRPRQGIAASMSRADRRRMALVIARMGLQIAAVMSRPKPMQSRLTRTRAPMIRCLAARSWRAPALDAAAPSRMSSAISACRAVWKLPNSSRIGSW